MKKVALAALGLTTLLLLTGCTAGSSPAPQATTTPHGGYPRGRFECL